MTALEERLGYAFRDPALRYADAASLLDDLDRLENGETPLAERELRRPRSQ